MPFTDNGYEPYGEDELYRQLRARFEGQFNVDVTAGDIVDKMLQAEASVISQFQENAISQIYDAAFVELASGRQLTMKAKELGVIRQDAVSATGTVVFSRDSPTSQTYPVPEETEVQTDGANATKFETTEDAILPLIDDFTSSTLSSAWNGDTGDATITSDDELKLPATDGSRIYRDDAAVGRGSLVHAYVEQEANTVSKTLFGWQDSSNYYQIVVDAVNGNLELGKVVEGSLTTLDSLSVTIPTGEELHLPIDWGINGDIEISIDGSSSGFLGTVSATDQSDFLEGTVALESGDANGSKFWSKITTQSVGVSVEAVEGGSYTNLPAGAIQVITNGLNGIKSVSNVNPTGNPDFVLTNGIDQTRGLKEEQDDELRSRVFSSLSGGGQATRGAIYTSVSNIDDVISLSIFTNAKSDDNTGSGGLPPYSSEVVVFGGSKDEIVEAIYDTMSFVDFLRLYGGARGVKETYEVYDETVDESFVGEISRPPKLDLEVTVDIVYRGEEYSGKSAVKEAIVKYIGGTNDVGESVIGLGVGDDVYASEIRTAVNSVPGVLGTTNILLDSNSDGTDDTVTDSDGLSIIDVADNEVAQVNVSTGAISVNETQK